MVKKLEASKQWVERYQVDSLSGENESYTVSKKVDGTWACSCPRWIFHKAPKVDCKHIEAVQAGFIPVAVVWRSPVELFAESYWGAAYPVMISRKQVLMFAEAFAKSAGTSVPPVEEAVVETVGEFKITRKFRAIRE